MYLYLRDFVHIHVGYPHYIPVMLLYLDLRITCINAIFIFNNIFNNRFVHKSRISTFNKHYYLLCKLKIWYTTYSANEIFSKEFLVPLVLFPHGFPHETRLHFVVWLLRLQDLRLHDAMNNAKVTWPVFALWRKQWPLSQVRSRVIPTMVHLSWLLW